MTPCPPEKPKKSRKEPKPDRKGLCRSNLVSISTGMRFSLMEFGLRILQAAPSVVPSRGIFTEVARLEGLLFIASVLEPLPTEVAVFLCPLIMFGLCVE